MGGSASRRQSQYTGAYQTAEVHLKSKVRHLDLKSGHSTRLEGRKSPGSRLYVQTGLKGEKGARVKSAAAGYGTAAQYDRKLPNGLKLTNVESAKSIKIRELVQRMSAEPVPFFKVGGGRAVPQDQLSPASRGHDLRTDVGTTKIKPSRPYSSSTAAVKYTSLAHRRRAAQVAKSTVYVDGLVEPIAYKPRSNNNQGNIKIDDIIKKGDEYADADEVNYGGGPGSVVPVKDFLVTSKRVSPRQQSTGRQSAGY